MGLTGSVRVAGAAPESITDGPGFRYTLFLQGCPHRCEGCHNPSTHDPSGGEEWKLDEIWRQISCNPMLSGVTLSGGEPFEQSGALLPLARAVREADLELAAYSGYTFERLCEIGGDMRALLELCDVLVDGPFIKAQRSLQLPFRGSHNQRIIDVRASINIGRAVLLRDKRWQQLLD